MVRSGAEGKPLSGGEPFPCRLVGGLGVNVDPLRPLGGLFFYGDQRVFCFPALGPGVRMELHRCRDAGDQEFSQPSGIFYMADRLVSVQKDPGQESVGPGKENGLHYIFIDHRKIPPSLDYSINGADLILIKETVKSIFSNLEK